MSTVEAFDSLTEAARASFPPQFCRIVAMREHGDVGYVLFDTRLSGEPYLYGVDYERIDGRWIEGGSGNGLGWSRLRPESDLGILTDWGQAPPGADRVRVEFEGQIREEPAIEGAYLVVWWNVPCPREGWPFAKAFRINGEWMEASGWP
jgi:hypothetical protein